MVTLLLSFFNIKLWWGAYTLIVGFTFNYILQYVHMLASPGRTWQPLSTNNTLPICLIELDHDIYSYTLILLKYPSTYILIYYNI